VLGEIDKKMRQIMKQGKRLGGQRCWGQSGPGDQTEAFGQKWGEGAAQIGRHNQVRCGWERPIGTGKEQAVIEEFFANALGMMPGG
jgi:hypothetical protein